MKNIEMYKANDGKIFFNEIECLLHELKEKMSNQNIQLDCFFDTNNNLQGIEISIPNKCWYKDVYKDFYSATEYLHLDFPTPDEVEINAYSTIRISYSKKLSKWICVDKMVMVLKNEREEIFTSSKTKKNANSYWTITDFH